MSGEKVSLVVWRDADTAPPDGAEVLFRFADETFAGYYEAFGGVYRSARGLVDESKVTAWAPLPVPSEATTLDIEDAADYLEAHADDRHAHGLTDTADELRGIANRLRALLPKGETDKETI